MKLDKFVKIGFAFHLKSPAKLGLTGHGILTFLRFLVEKDDVHSNDSSVKLLDASCWKTSQRIFWQKPTFYPIFVGNFLEVSHNNITFLQEDHCFR